MRLGSWLRRRENLVKNILAKLRLTTIIANLCCLTTTLKVLDNLNFRLLLMILDINYPFHADVLII